MNRRIVSLFGIALTCMGTCAIAARAAQPSMYDNPQGIDVLTRGPVHEAFAETVTFNPEPGIVVPRSPGEIIEELPPDQRPEGANVTWIPGYWAWDDESNDFLWVSGVWRDLPPGREWIPGYWGQLGQGYQWTSGYWADSAIDEIEYLPEPPQSMERGPNIVAPSSNQGWIPGSWVWNQDRYAWRPGYWAAGRADWEWIPAHYIWTPRGYVFSDGYWDHAIERRGVLFAPVHFGHQQIDRRNISYSPTIAINLAVFSDQLFVRPRYQHYYFGDYYDSRYQTAGYIPSYSYQSSRHGYDPIYAHRQWEHRRESGWEGRDQQVYNHRRDVVDARPARTLVEQVSRRLRRTSAGDNRIEVAAPFAQLMSRHEGVMHFQKVDNAERQQLGRRGRAVQDMRRSRQTIEARVRASGNEGAQRKAEPTRARLPQKVIVAKRSDQIDKKYAPPKRHRVPTPDPSVKPAKKVRAPSGQHTKAEPKAKKAESKPDSSKRGQKAGSKGHSKDKKKGE